MWTSRCSQASGLPCLLRERRRKINRAGSACYVKGHFGSWDWSLNGRALERGLGRRYAPTSHAANTVWGIQHQVASDNDTLSARNTPSRKAVPEARGRLHRLCTSKPGLRVVKGTIQIRCRAPLRYESAASKATVRCAWYVTRGNEHRRSRCTYAWIGPELHNRSKGLTWRSLTLKPIFSITLPPSSSASVDSFNHMSPTSLYDRESLRSQIADMV